MQHPSPVSGLAPYAVAGCHPFHGFPFLIFPFTRGLGLRVSLSLACYALTGRSPR